MSSYADSPDVILDAFRSPHRRAIIREIYHGFDWSARQGLSFTELQERADIEDSGAFNYHLNRVPEILIERVDGEYRPNLNHAKAVFRLMAWSHIDHPPRGPIETDQECPHCGESLVARYRQQVLTFDCGAEDKRGVAAYWIPYGCARERELPDLIEIGLRFRKCRTDWLRSGVCPTCFGAVDPEVVLDRRTNQEPELKPLARTDSRDGYVRVKYECGYCGDTFVPMLAYFALHSPEGLSFMRNSGIDPLVDPEANSMYSDHLDGGRVVSRDPVRLETTLTTTDDHRTFVFDGMVDIVAVEGPTDTGAPDRSTAP